MRVDLFYFTETNLRSWSEQVALGAHCYSGEVADDSTLDQILAASGLPKGSSRGGVFQIQTDRGIWVDHRPAFVERGFGRLDPAKAVFKTWAEVDAE
jgi:hypothetical protein